MLGRFLLGLLIATITSTCAADIVINATETTNGDVLFEYSGSIDTTGLTAATFNVPDVPNRIHPSEWVVSFGTTGSDWTTYHAGLTPPAFGDSPDITNADVANTGDLFAVFGSGFVLPEGYTGFNPDSSIATLSGSMRFIGTSFSLLGVTPGSYDWTTEDGQVMTLNIGAGTVPEPSCVILIFFAGVFFTSTRRFRNIDS